MAAYSNKDIVLLILVTFCLVLAIDEIAEREEGIEEGDFKNRTNCSPPVGNITISSFDDTTPRDPASQADCVEKFEPKLLKTMFEFAMIVYGCSIFAIFFSLKRIRSWLRQERRLFTTEANVYMFAMVLTNLNSFVFQENSWRVVRIFAYLSFSVLLLIELLRPAWKLGLLSGLLCVVAYKVTAVTTYPELRLVSIAFCCIAVYLRVLADWWRVQEPEGDVENQQNNRGRGGRRNGQGRGQNGGQNGARGPMDWLLEACGFLISCILFLLLVTIALAIPGTNADAVDHLIVDAEQPWFGEGGLSIDQIDAFYTIQNVEPLNHFLVVGMIKRRNLLDDALIRYQLRNKVEIEHVAACWQRYGGNLSVKSSEEQEASAVGLGGGFNLSDELAPSSSCSPGGAGPLGGQVEIFLSDESGSLPNHLQIQSNKMKEELYLTPDVSLRRLEELLRNINRFSYKELSLATDDFHLSNKIGRGGFGTVYKGTLRSGIQVAVKKLSAESKQGVCELWNGHGSSTKREDFF